jgi:hypothetical protein
MEKQRVKVRLKQETAGQPMMYTFRINKVENNNSKDYPRGVPAPANVSFASRLFLNP